MRPHRLGLLTLIPLAGCAATLAGQSQGDPSLVSVLSSFGLDARQSRCVADRVGTALTPSQAQRLARAAVPPSDAPARNVRDLMRIASDISDSRIGVEIARAAGACAALPDIAVRRPGVATQPSPSPGAGRAPAWLNLGRAPTGQSIAVDAASLEQEASSRKAWFRLTNPGAAAPTGTAYLLRIDCPARTIQSLAQRRDTGPNPGSQSGSPDPPGPIEAGTVMEIAYLALCT